MGVPATTGQLRTNLAGMKVGDFIICKYTALSGAVGAFDEIGTSIAAELPIAGSAAPNGAFYFVKVDKGLLIADRVVQHTITWDKLNAGKFIQGNPQTFGNVTGVIRSLSGGVAYADANGNSTLDARLSSGICFPINNEYDEFLMGFPSALITEGYTLDDVFHYGVLFTWTQDTTLTGTRVSNTGTTEAQTNVCRVIRGNENNFSIWKSLGMGSSSTAYASTGFRPVFEFRE